MGLYTGSTRYYGGSVHDYAAEIPANEAYDATLGCAQILADCQKNDMALFEGAIYDDMREVASYYNEGVQVVNENAFTNVIKKIVEMFKKLLGKIKGIFKAFIAKLSGAFSDGKSLVKKYEKQILKYSNWNKFKLKKVRKPKQATASGVFTAIQGVFEFKPTITYEVKSTNFNKDADIGGIGNSSKIKTMDSAELQEKIAKTGYIATGVTLSDGLKDLHEDVMDHLWNDEDALDGEDDKISSSTFTSDWIKGVISDEKKTLERLKVANNNAEKHINKIIDDLSKLDDKLAKLATDSGNSVDTEVEGEWLTANDRSSNGFHDYHASNRNYSSVNSHLKNEPTKAASGGVAIKDVQEYVHALQTVASAEQEVCTKCCTELLAQYKFAIGQGKRIWAAAAAYSSMQHKNESVEYIQALGESVEEEFYMNMESIH